MVNYECVFEIGGMIEKLTCTASCHDSYNTILYIVVVVKAGTFLWYKSSDDDLVIFPLHVLWSYINCIQTWLYYISILLALCDIHFFRHRSHNLITYLLLTFVISLTLTSIYFANYFLCNSKLKMYKKGYLLVFYKSERRKY